MNEIKGKVLLSYSAGKDSTAMLLFAIEKGIDFVAAYQDTVFENPLLYMYLDYIEQKTGAKILRIKSKKYNGFVDMIEKKQAIPNRVARFCTSNLKTDAMKELLRIRNNISEVWVGVRQAESQARAKRYAGLSFDDTFPLSTYPDFGVREFGHIDCRLPIVDWTDDDVWAIHKKHNIKRNPLYDLGDKRVGCYPCILSSEEAWYNVWKTEHGKKNIERLAELEEMVANNHSDGIDRTFRQGKSVRQMIWQFRLRDSQGDLFTEFNNEDEAKCSWCHG